LQGPLKYEFNNDNPYQQYMIITDINLIKVRVEYNWWFHQGTLIEHLIGQELLAFQYNALSALHFWVREKKESTAEVDYLFSYNGLIIPIEVKSGKEGTLKSLHSYMDIAPHNFAIRFYAGALNITDAITQNGKQYKILNLPYYLGSQIEKYIDWFIQPNYIRGSTR
jgi:predicted AAA+ superfamily ATPase